MNAFRPPVHVLTGFLGSGKTTLLNRLLRRPEMASTAVLINELGAIGIDHLVIESIDDEIVVLESGCVCCDLRDELTGSLLNLFRKREAGAIPPFEQVVLETTGVASPASVVQQLMADEFVCASFRIGKVATVVDAVYCLEQLAEHEEAGEQVAAADSIAISKCDLTGPSGRAAAEDAVRTMNPLAVCANSHCVDPVFLFGTAAGGLDGSALARVSGGTGSPPGATPAGPRGHASARYHAFRLSWEMPAEWAAIEEWLSGLLFARGDDILRLKGVVRVAGATRGMLIQGVRQSLFAPVPLAGWPRGYPATDLVFITRHFSKSAALRSLQPFLATADVATA